MCQNEVSMVVIFQILQAFNIIFENVRDKVFISRKYKMNKNNCR